MTTSTDIVNQAIQLIGDNQPLVTGVAPTFDDSPAGQAAAQLYTPCVQTVARQFGWDFERNTAVLATSGNTPPDPWQYEYLYPANGIQVWQIKDQTESDANDPLPINWVVANNLVSSVPTKVIQCNIENAYAVFSNQPGESLWDPGFREAVVRLLASELAAALEGRPDTARDMLQSSGQFEGMAEARDS